MLTFEREAYRVHFDGGLLGDRFARMRVRVCVCVGGQRDVDHCVI